MSGRRVGPYRQPDLSPEEELARVRRRIPKFAGIIPAEDGQWEARIRHGTNGTGRWETIGVFATAELAFVGYKAHRHVRPEKVESTVKIDALLALSDRCRPAEVETRSLFGSSLDLTSELWRGTLDY